MPYHFQFCSYAPGAKFLEERLKISRTIPGAQKLHCIILLSNTKILTKDVFKFKVAKEERATRVHKTEIPIDETKEFVTAVYEDNWWLGCVLQVNQDDKTITGA